MHRLIATAVLLGIGLPVQAEERRVVNCQEDSGSYVTAYCSELEYQAADARLNAIYSQLKRRLPPERFASLRRSQREWIRRRDATCREETSDSIGATGWRTFYNECLTVETVARVSELEAIP